MAIVIGVTGLIGSGKDTVARYIAKKYGFSVISMGDIVRKIVRELGLPMNRENQQHVGYKYKERITEEMLKEVRKHGKVIMVGIRKWADYNEPKKEFGKNFYLIVVRADKEKRFERLKKRGRDGDPKTFSEFLKQEKREKEFFDFNRIFPKADFVIENSKGFGELYREIGSVMEKLERNLKHCSKN